MSGDDSSGAQLQYLTTDRALQSAIKAASRKHRFRVKLSQFKNGLKARYTGLKASLLPGTIVPTPLLELPPEIRDMIWDLVARDGHFVLRVHTEQKDAGSRCRIVDSMPWHIRDSVMFKKLPHTKVCMRRSPNGCRIEPLLVCKQMLNEITAAYFRNRTVEVRQSIDWVGKYHRSTFFPIKAPRAIDIMSNVRHLSTFVRLHPVESWRYCIQDMAWFFRLLRLCPQIRTVQITVHWWLHGANHVSPAIDPHAEGVRALIPTQVQLVFSKALALMPLLADSVDGPRLTRASPLDRYHSFYPEDEERCLCTWTATFHFVPSKSPRAGPGVDFHNPAVDDWSNQILFNHRLKRNKNVHRNLLERQLGMDMRRPGNLLPLNHERPPAREECIEWDDYWRVHLSRRTLVYCRVRFLIQMTLGRLLHMLGI